MQATHQATPDARSRLSNVRYAEKEYWNNRYTSQPCEFDWFYGYTALHKLVRTYIKRSKLVLHVGCGNSNFQEGMAKDGYQIINTDISDVVIEQMRAKHKDVPGLRYVVSDCRKMPEFLDCQFGSVIDKGTVDALLCSKDAAENVISMFREISRVLVPGGTFLLVTLGGPAQRLALVNRPEFGWGVQVCLVRRVSDDQFAPSAPGRAIPLNDTSKPLSCIGPLTVQPDGTLDGLPEPFDPSSYFYAYACRKAPLVLAADNSGAAGSKVRLPDGWRATVRAVAEVISGEMGLPQGILGRGRRVKVTSRASFERFQREREQAQQQQWRQAQEAQLAEDLATRSSAPPKLQDRSVCQLESDGKGADGAGAPQAQQGPIAAKASSADGGPVRAAISADGLPYSMSASAQSAPMPYAEAHPARTEGGRSCAAGHTRGHADGSADDVELRIHVQLDSDACISLDDQHRASHGGTHAAAIGTGTGDDPSAVAAGPSAIGQPPSHGSPAAQPSGCQADAPQQELSDSCDASPPEEEQPPRPSSPLPRPLCRAGSTLVPRSVSYSRLCDGVQDAFAVLDAVGGEGQSGNEPGRTTDKGCAEGPAGSESQAGPISG